MSVAEIIKQAREELGLTQEDLAEKLEVSRQAVSKWELGASAPSPENLRVLEKVLGVTFPPEEDGAGEDPKAEPRRASPWKIAALALGGLLAAAVVSLGLFIALFSLAGRTEEGASEPAGRQAPAVPWFVSVSFFDENADPLQPNLGDGWQSFTAGERVLLVARFQDNLEVSVNAVSLFLTPTGTETFDQRRQLAVQAVYDGRDFALFALDIPEDLMGHLDIVLECSGGLSVTETLNVTSARP